MEADENEKPECRIEAKSLLNIFAEYETALLVIIWDKILQRLDSTNKYLQDPKMNLHKAVKLLNSLKEFVSKLRDNFKPIEEEAVILSEKTSYKSEKKRTKKRKIFFDETKENEVFLTGKNLFVTETFIVICDTVYAELCRRMEKYSETLNMFSIFFENSNETTMETCLTKLIDAYKDDIDIFLFKEEIQHFLENAKEEGIKSPHVSYNQR